jgi:predicted hydrocarbon binding protein
MSEDRMMPNAALYVLFAAMAEVMGENGLKSVLRMGKLERYLDSLPPNNTDPGVKFSEYAAAQQAIEDFYGPRGARAILVRIGRALFRYTLEEQPAVLGLAGLALKALPMGARIKLILQKIVSSANTTLNMPSHLEETDDAYVFVAENSPSRWRPPRSKPGCYVTIGTYQEALRWATGRNFRIVEVSCMAAGDDACRFHIYKEPLESS